MTPETVEAFAIRCALGNNGGEWAEHYTEAQKEHWRQFVRDLVEPYDKLLRRALALGLFPAGGETEGDARTLVGWA